MFFTRHSRYPSESEISVHFPVADEAESQIREESSPAELEKEVGQVAENDASPLRVTVEDEPAVPVAGEDEHSLHAAREDEPILHEAEKNAPALAAKLAENVSISEMSQPEHSKNDDVRSNSQFESELRMGSLPRENIQLNIEARPSADPKLSREAPVQQRTELMKEPRRELDAKGDTPSRQAEVGTPQPEIGAIPRSVEAAEEAVHQQVELTPSSEAGKTPVAEVESQPDQNMNLLRVSHSPPNLSQHLVRTPGLQYEAPPMEQLSRADQGSSQEEETNWSPRLSDQSCPNPEPELLKQNQKSGLAGAFQRGVSEDLGIDSIQDSVDTIRVAHPYSPSYAALSTNKRDAARPVAQHTRNKSPERRLGNHPKIQEPHRQIHSSHQRSISPDVRMQLQADESQRGPSPQLGLEFDPMESTFISGMDADSRMDLDDEPYSSQPIRTPSRRRQRVNEIAASDNESEFTPSSPERSPDTTFHRPSKRLRTPQSEPSRRASPVRPAAPAVIQRMPEPVLSLFKPEKKPDNSSPWLKQQVEAMRLRYPDDIIESDNGTIVCGDCERTFHPGNNNSLGGISGHFRSKLHKENRSKRLENASRAETREDSLAMDFGPSGTPTAGFALPANSHSTTAQQPLAMSMQHEHERAFASMKQYHIDMENSFRATTLQSYKQDQGRLIFEKRILDRTDQLEASIAASDRADKAKYQNMCNRIDDLYEQRREQTEVVQERLNVVDSRIDEVMDYTTTAKDHIDSIEEKTSRQLNDMFTKLARSDHRNIERFEGIGVAQSKVIQDQQKVVQDHQKLSEQHHKLAGEHEKHVHNARRWEKTARLQHETASTRVGALEKKIDDQRTKVQRIEGELQSQEKSAFEQTHIYREAIQRLEEQGDKQQKSQEMFKKAVEDQLEAQMQQFRKKLSSMDRETRTAVGVMKDEFTDMRQKHVSHINKLSDENAELRSRLDRLAQDETDLKRKFKRLEKDKSELQELVDKFKAVIPTILDDANVLREFCEVEFAKRPEKVEEVKRAKMLKEKSGNASPLKEHRVGKTSAPPSKENAHANATSSKHQLNRTTPVAQGKENEHMSPRKAHQSTKIRSPLRKRNAAEMSE